MILSTTYHSVRIINHTNIILITVPDCYDLPALSYVNNEVKIANRKLMKHLKPNNHIFNFTSGSKQRIFYKSWSS
jgi:hypothetical protein